MPKKTKRQKDKRKKKERWILLRLAYVLLGVIPKRRTSGGDKKEVNEDPSPWSLEDWDPGANGRTTPVVREQLLSDSLYHHADADAGIRVELQQFPVGSVCSLWSRGWANQEYENGKVNLPGTIRQRRVSFWAVIIKATWLSPVTFEGSDAGPVPLDTCDSQFWVPHCDHEIQKKHETWALPSQGL